MSFYDHGYDPAGQQRREYQGNLLSSGDAANYDDRAASFAADDQFVRPPQPPKDDPYALGDLERTLYRSNVYDDEGNNRGSGFNQMWMRDHWQGRQGLGSGDEMMQARGSIGGGIGADLLAAERGHVFADRLQGAPAAPARSNKVMGQYFSTFGERMRATGGGLGGFFKSLFGRGMRRANQARAGS